MRPPALPDTRLQSCCKATSIRVNCGIRSISAIRSGTGGPRRRQAKPELDARRSGSREFGAPAVRLGHRACDGQTEPGAAFVGARGDESPERALPYLRGHGAGVLDTDDPLVAFAPHPDDHTVRA